jgi:predicted ester cyclase
MSAEQNKATLALWAAAYNERNLEKLDQLADGVCTEDYALHPNASGRPPGPAGLKQSVHGFVANWPDMRVTVDDMIAEGDKVASRWTIRGTDLRQQKEMTLMMIFISRFVGDKIAEEWLVGQPIEEGQT